MKTLPLALAALLLGALAARAQEPPDLPLIDLKDPAAFARVSPEQGDQATVSRSEAPPGVNITFRPGERQYPGAVVKPEAAVWDLSRFGHVDARFANTGPTEARLSVRVDNDGDWQLTPWNCEFVTVKPGQTATVRVRFGYSFGKPGYALDAAKVTRVLIFTEKPAEEKRVRLEALVAGGVAGEKPPVDPGSLRVQPPGGVLLGPGASIDPGKQIVGEGGARGEWDGTALHVTLPATPRAVWDADRQRVTLPAGAAKAAVLLKAPVGLWDLREYLQVTVRVRNDGPAAVTPRARLENRGRQGTWVSAAAPLAPGASLDLILPFRGDVVTLVGPGQPPTGGSLVDSDATSAVAVAADGEAEETLTVQSVQAGLPPTPALPDWLGKRPPVPGDWTLTLNENFDAPTINDKLWSVYHANYWDKASHFSKENAILGDGRLRLRFEKKRGHADDDPAKPETDWATGHLIGERRWSQRYGYFEARMKLPRAPGMWPAFWMMPDPGKPSEGPWMEFDIMEYLARYGPYRYNIACHWDGYGKDHKSTGTERLYFQPDAEGYVTSGMLWEPGKVTFYAQGNPLVQWSFPRISSVAEHIIFTAVSGGWGAQDLTGEGLPSDFVIDYVRVWQRADLAALPVP